MDLYYNAGFGYLVCAQTTIRGSAARTVIEPVTVLPPDASDGELGDAIWKSLERSRTARPIDRTEAGKYKFWYETGIKSYVSFSKQFFCLDITLVGREVQILPLERDPDGGYNYPTYSPQTVLHRDRPSEELGAAVKAVLSGRTLPEDDDFRSFETVQGSRVTYRRPSDLFLDGGDGHTDAYQVYWQAEYPNNVMAFLISDRYTNELPQCSGADVRRHWQAEYGQLLYFNFSRHKGGGPWMEARGRTADKAIIAYVFPDGVDTMEVMLEVDLVNTPDEVQEQFFHEFEAMVLSIQIEPFEERAPASPPPPEAPPDRRYVLPKKCMERVFIWVELVLTGIAACITYYPIHEAWEYMSFAGIGSLIMFVLLGPGLIGLVAEAVLFFLTLREGRMGYTLAAYVIQIICGLPSTCLVIFDPVIFSILGVHTVLMVLAFIGLIVHLSLAYQRR